jgi:8-oxo-dGTP diphosphatase
MSIGRFYGGIAALIWSRSREKYLLLQRSPEKDFASGVWECVTGRVDQGEGFVEALQREVREELGLSVQAEMILGTTHFYRGPADPHNELIGVVFGCSIQGPQDVRLSREHSQYRWVTIQEARELLTAHDSSTAWMRRVLARAEALRARAPQALLEYQRGINFELG